MVFRVVKRVTIKLAQQCTIVTTDAEKGILKQIANKEGYRQFVVSEVVGGR